MNEKDKKSSFRVPDTYFDHFDEKIVCKINPKNPVNGFIIPPDYFQEVENQILNKIQYPKLKNSSHFIYSWRLMALGAFAFIAALFFLNEKTVINQTELSEFFIEDYLTYNTTYEIAELSDYSFEIGNFNENYESIATDDAMEIILYGETPTNLNLFDDE